MSIRIDQEFKSLIPPLSPEEYAQLEENILSEGIRDPLVVWHVPNGDDILIDGHNRFKISAKHGGVPFQVKRMTFDVRDDVKAWIIRNQLGRRNLNTYNRSVLALELKPLITKQAKQNQGARNDICQKSDKSIDTKKELAAIADVSHDTIHKVETIENSGNEDLKKQVRSGELSINQGYKIAKGIQDNKSPAQMKKEFLKEVEDSHQEIKESKIVSLDAAKEDKGNRAILAKELYASLLKAGKGITNAFIDIHEDGKAELIKEFTEDQRNTLAMTFSVWVSNLTELMEVIGF